MTCVSTRIHGLYIQNFRYVLLPLAESGIEHASTLWEWGNRAHFFIFFPMVEDNFGVPDLCVRLVKDA